MSLNITVSSTRAMTPARITFDANPTTFTPDTWLWSFGDGHTSQYKKVTHVYNDPGVFDVTLTIVDTEGISHSETLSQHVAIFKIDINRTEITGKAPFTTKFSYTSYIPTGFLLSSYSWDFGDGSDQSVESSPVHTFSTSGTYGVQFIAEILEV